MRSSYATMRLLVQVLLATALPGFVMAGTSKSLPANYVGWAIGYTAPPYTDVWIETIDVEDVRGRTFDHIGSGTASTL